MNAEIDVPSPEEMGLTPSDEASTDVERIGNLFEEQVNRDIEGQQHEIVALDKSRLYVNLHKTYPSGSEVSNRIYGALDPSTGSDNEAFRNLSTAVIFSNESKNVTLAKFGREAPASLSPDYSDPKVQNELEQLTFKGVFEQTITTNEQGNVGYLYTHIKGSEVGFGVTFDSAGKLARLTSFTGPHGFATRYDKAILYDNSALTPQQSKGNFSFSEAEGKYSLSLKDEQGNTHYIVRIPQLIAVAEVVEETRVDQIQKHPDSPPEADDQWRHANFPQLLGIEIEPVHDIDME